MAIAAAISLTLLIVHAIEQLIAAIIFVFYCRRTKSEPTDDEPEVLVILPVRGADETLAQCVAGLAQQDYANFRVRVIFDSPTDPGYQIVDSVLDSYPHLAIEQLQLANPRRTCSLKCSAVYEATEDLGNAEFVALVDSDIVPHNTWLRELIAPFADEKIGVTHGNRWYLPEIGKAGSLLRYCWNACASVTMFMWEMPWGGTMAIRRRVLEETGIRERWLLAGCEDVPLGFAVKEIGLKTRFVPSLIMKDREETTIGNCLPFLDRQLLWARLYYPACWWVSNVWQVLVAAALIVACASFVLGVALGRVDLVWMGAAGLLIPNAAATVLMGWLERTIVPEELGPVRRQPMKVFFAITITNVAMVRVIMVSLLTRVIHWRGITYRIDGPWTIEMEEYRPYSVNASHDPAAELTSVTTSV